MNVSLADVFMRCVVGDEAEVIVLAGSLGVNRRVVVSHAREQCVERLLLVLVCDAGIGQCRLIGNVNATGTVQCILQGNFDRWRRWCRSLLGGKRKGGKETDAQAQNRK